MTSGWTDSHVLVVVFCSVLLQVVIPTVSGVDPTLSLRTKPIFELTNSQTAAFAAAQIQYPTVFGGPSTATATASTATGAAAVPPPVATASTGTAAAGSVPAPSKLDDAASAQWLSQALEAALDSYNEKCVAHAARANALAKSWSAHSASNFVANAFATPTSAPGTASAAGAPAPTSAGSGGSSAATVVSAQTAAKRKQRENAMARELNDMLRVEFQGKRLK